MAAISSNASWDYLTIFPPKQKQKKKERKKEGKKIYIWDMVKILMSNDSWQYSLQLFFANTLQIPIF